MTQRRTAGRALGKLRVAAGLSEADVAVAAAVDIAVVALVEHGIITTPAVVQAVSAAVSSALGNRAGGSGMFLGVSETTPADRPSDRLRDEGPVDPDGLVATLDDLVATDARGRRRRRVATHLAVPARWLPDVELVVWDRAMLPEDTWESLPGWCGYQVSTAAVTDGCAAVLVTPPEQTAAELPMLRIVPSALPEDARKLYRVLCDDGVDPVEAEEMASLLGPLPACH